MVTEDWRKRSYLSQLLKIFSKVYINNINWKNVVELHLYFSHYMIKFTVRYYLKTWNIKHKIIIQFKWLKNLLLNITQIVEINDTQSR